jgi:NADPH-dependent 2,4-dienoyl-CoA reductase/sulfur reductase-like enzyme
MDFDLAILGAGPAGLAAARTAAEHGLSVVLLDEQATPGGQIYRDVDRVAPLRGDILGKDYTEGRALTQGLGASGVTHISGATVWAIEEGHRISYTRDGRGAQLTAGHILIATGALERPMPLPGWTLPGVMTAGAAQILLKQSGILARRAVLVGCGPLLYLIGAQMVRAGTPPLALLETQTRGDGLRALRHGIGMLRGWRYALKGLKMLIELRRARVPRYTAAHDIRITGTDHAEAVEFTANGQTQTMACDTILLHHGVTPNTQAARSIDIPHHWDARQACYQPQTDAWGGTGLPTVHIAGDGAGIGGAKAAALAGQIAALDIAHHAGRLAQGDRDLKARPLFDQLKAERAPRAFLDTAYPPFAPALAPDDKTIICRCEEVIAGDIRRFATMGCKGPNQAKAFGRAGMGPCQGRYCGLTVSTLLAQANGQDMDTTGYYRIRPPLKPVTLGELAAMNKPEQDAAE